MQSGKVEAAITRLGRMAVSTLLGLGMASALAQTVDLADRPLFSTNNVPGNLMLALSVEWPTANTPAYLSTNPYASSTKYLGYFDPNKCYSYVYVAADATQSYFAPSSAATSSTCTSTSSSHRWSGNYLNWAAMQSLDIFRWTLTGGDRAVDTVTSTILEKTRESGQAGTSVFADKTLSATVSSSTPFSSSSLESRGRTMGTFVRFWFNDTPLNCSFSVNSNRNVTSTCTPFGSSALTCSTGNSNPGNGGSATCNAGPVGGATMSCTTTRSSNNTYNFSCSVTSPNVAPEASSCAHNNRTYSSSSASGSCSSSGTTDVDYTGTGSLTAGRAYRAQIRVKACDSAVGLESNCKQYGSNYKPEGLMQQYAMQLRYGAFGYLNDVSDTRDGGVLRARMKSVGPQVPVPGSAAITNTSAEWSTSTGILNVNPDSADASATSTDAAAAGYTVTVGNSGVINYLNRFGKLNANTYKSKDPVSEMYYAATRYFRNQGPVASYSNLAGAGSQATLARWIDGFPVIRQWNDPIQYSCQKNFILGIGDVYTHYDNNLPGTVLNSSPAIEPTMPSEVASDGTVNVTTVTNMVGTLEGIANLGSTRTGSASHGSYYVAGLAYDAHTKDIRPESAMPGTQTISTYWLDVRENQTYESRNQYWLAAKYGGFEVPAGFDPYATSNDTSTLTQSMWTRPGQLVGADQRPNNYFIASDPAAMAAGLRSAFESIASENEAASTTAFSTTTAKVSRTGTASYATKFNPRAWSGDVEASEITFNQYGVPELAVRWNAGALLDAATPGSRKIVTCCTSANAALPFRDANLSSATLHARTNYASFASVPGVTGAQTRANYLNYLRGVRTMEDSYSSGIYRSRSSVLGDIVGSKANPVGRPLFPYADQFNPGYGTFKNTYANRKNVVFVGANDGMLHAFDGTLPVSGTCATGTCGSELFAFIPSFAYNGASAAAVDGLASLGNPNFTHHYLVDATAQNFDVDFFNTPGATATAPDWRTMLIGGLGKGGRGYYALDVTDPSTWTSETALAGKFLWEFTDSRLGNTFGEATVVKTRKYGWTVIVPSGYNNSDGKGYLFLINPRTGALLEAISTPEGSVGAPINLAHANAFVPSFRDFTADAIYAGDMRGNVWRFDLTAASGVLPQATKIATLTDSSGNAQPVTTRPLVEVDPSSNKRYVVVATGRLLADSDINNSQRQTLYVIADGTSGSGEFYTPATLPASVTFPVGRNNLNNNTNPLTGIGSTPAQAMGWYLDLQLASNGVAERVNTDMSANLGSVLAAVNLPDGQACAGSGTGRLVGLRLSDGRTVLVEENTSTGTDDLVASRSVNGVITTLSFLTVNGQTRAYYGTSRASTSGSSVGSGGVTATTRCGSGGDIDCGNLDRSGATLRRLNWREVQTAN